MTAAERKALVGRLEARESFLRFARAPFGTVDAALIGEAVRALRKADAELAALREAATAMAKYLKNYPFNSWDNDHACAECCPGDSMVIAGFRCGRHIAFALLASPGNG
jgi:hypothetical protein